jgi:hypothetical protein
MNPNFTIEPRRPGRAYLLRLLTATADVLEEGVEAAAEGNGCAPQSALREHERLAAKIRKALTQENRASRQIRNS